MQWQPIETAPADTEVIITGYNWNNPKKGRWACNAVLTDGEWYFCLSDEDERPHPPTHWMPMPEELEGA